MDKIDGDVLFNKWLKYHNTNITEIKKRHSKLLKSGKWMLKYPVTQKQFDSWEKWAKKYVIKQSKLSKEVVNESWWIIYLNYSPVVKN